MHFRTQTCAVLNTLKVVIPALVLALGVSYAYAAWSGPTATPPGDNVAAPINVGAVDQIKSAGLGVNTLAIFGKGSFDGEVIIGSTGAACAANLEGAIRYDSGRQCLQLCTNAGWGDVACSVTSTADITLSSDVTDYDFASDLSSKDLLAGARNYEILIEAGVAVGASSTTNPAFTTGGLPAGSTVTIINHGRIQGKGGNGAASNTFGEIGLPGGDALNLTVSTTIDNTDGEIWSGGGGGGGGVSYSIGSQSYDACGGGGGGGGAGFNPGSGVFFHPGQPQWNYIMGAGADGTTEAGGAGSGDPRGPSCSNQRGGDGGNPGEAGDPSDNSWAGGATGLSLKTNGNTVTWINQGDIQGTIQ